MRSFSRFSTDEDVVLAVDGASAVGRLYNLSSGGCMIELLDHTARAGAWVDVHLRDIASVRGRVVWRVGDQAGIEFLTPLQRRTVEQLGYTASAEEFDAADPRDRFGLPLFG